MLCVLLKLRRVAKKTKGREDSGDTWCLLLGARVEPSSQEAAWVEERCVSVPCQQAGEVRVSPGRATGVCDTWCQRVREAAIDSWGLVKGRGSQLAGVLLPTFSTVEQSR